MQYECNVGGRDRAVRIGAGTGLLAMGMLLPMPKWLKTTAEALGLVGITTGVVRFCPVSKMAGRNTCVRVARVEPEASAPVE